MLKKQFLINLFVPLLLLILGENAFAYNKAAHEWIIEKAVEFVKSKSDGVAKKYPLDNYLPRLYFGSSYADGTDVTCTWIYPGGSEKKSCDTIHHYGQVGDIKLYRGGFPPILTSGLTVANTGDFAAPFYAGVLYEQALRFWPGKAKPDLSALPYKDAGSIEAKYIVGEEQLLGHTYVGGLPLCELYVALKQNTDLISIYECPKWPQWAATSPDGKLTQQNVKTAMIYLGWAIHMVEDMTVPVHAHNEADEWHQAYEDKIDCWIGRPSPQQQCTEADSRGSFGHLPLVQQPAYNNPPCGRCTKGLYWYPVIGRYDPLPNWSAEQFATEARRIALTTEDGTSIQPSWEDYQNVYRFDAYRSLISEKAIAEVGVDAAIKLVAALLEKYFTEISLPPDAFEPNDRYDQAKFIGTGVYEGLTLDNPQDEDWVRIHVPEGVHDVTVDVYFDQTLGTPAIFLLDSGYQFFGFPQQTAYGLKIEKKAVTVGDYFLHVFSFDQQPIRYSLRVSIGPRVLPADEYEKNDTPTTAKPFFTGCSSENQLTIDRPGDVDYYSLPVADTQRLDVTIRFDPTGGDLKLTMDDKQGIQIQSGAAGISALRVSECGKGGAAIVRVSGPVKRYSMCMGFDASDPTCGYVPPPAPPPVRVQMVSDVALDNIHVITLPKAQGVSSLYLPADTDGDGGGNIPAGDSDLMLTPAFKSSGETHFLVIGTTEDEKKLVISSSANLAGAQFDMLFLEFQGLGSLQGLISDLSDGKLADVLIMPCVGLAELPPPFNVCRSPFHVAGTPDGILLTPLQNQAKLYAFPGGNIVGTVRVGLKRHWRQHIGKELLGLVSTLGS
jgi:hypothetical protein